jgi:uncharacterized protein YbaP (TraB family)
MKEANKKSLLWSVEFSEQPTHSYLFGTMHVQDQTAFSFVEQAYDKLKVCNKLALEFNLDDAPTSFDPNIISLPDGLSLDQLISGKKFNKARDFLMKTCQIDLWQLRFFTPFFIVNTITSQLLSKDMPVALDEHLWQYAKKNGIPGIGIETYQEQLTIISQIPLEQQLKDLLSICRNLTAYRRKVIKLSTVYASGDIFRIYKAAKKSASGVREELIYRRNAIMAERIAVYARQESVFFAIGAGHLAGGKGVLRYLKKRGAKIRPINI